MDRKLFTVLILISSDLEIILCDVDMYSNRDEGVQKLFRNFQNGIFQGVF